MKGIKTMLAFALALGLGCGSCSRSERSPIPSSCAIGGAMPSDGASLVARIDKLGRPLTLPCFIASLPRPLRVVATDSTFSVQPADGRESPRVFILGEDMVLSIALAGPGRELLEFGEWYSSVQTIKGELEFPIEGEIGVSQAYVGPDTISTRCAACHRNEEPSQVIDGAYISDAIRPQPQSLVPLAELQAERERCNLETDRARCELLSALLDFGVVEEGAFDPNIPVFF